MIEVRGDVYAQQIAGLSKDCVAQSPYSAVASMTGAEFRVRLNDLGRTQSAFAQEIGHSPRSISRWMSEGPPSEIAYLVDLLSTLELHVSPDLGSDSGRGSDVDFRVELDGLFERAIALGRGPEFIEATRRWILAATKAFSV